ncbi:MAG: DUF3566 domain-containing protein [Actinomycetota bacterium]|nr:DUF3566 domain-containing protein [Actinomycetota bacterium]
MTDSDQGTVRRGLGRVAEQMSGAAQSAVERVTPDRSGNVGEPSGKQPPVGSASQTRSPAKTTKSTVQGKAAPKRKPRKARLRLVQVDAWSVMKTAFLLSIAMGIVTVVAVGIVWTVLGAAGVWDSLNNTIQTVMGNSFRVQDYIGTSRVLGFTMIVAVVDVVLLTAIATLGAFLYNLAATLLGGVEVTLAEDT